MLVEARTRAQMRAGFTCACGAALPGTPLLRVSCPKCRQVYVVRPSAPARPLEA